MQSKTIKSSQQIRPIVKARFSFIVLQLIAILLSQFWIQSELPFLTLYAIVALETALNVMFVYLYRTNRNVSINAYFIQVVMDILFLTALLYFSGGASNPFVSLLLLPIAIASVTLPKHLLLVVTLLAMSAYSSLLLTLSPHDLHHMNMEQHLFGMWLNFLLSAFVVVLVVASLIKAVNKQEKLVSKQREDQLRQEQLLSLGAAAAQFAHRLATPLGTVHLISEELQDIQTYDESLFNQLDQELSVCRRHLDDFRAMAEQVKNNSKQSLGSQAFINDLRQEVQLSFPSTKVIWQVGELANLSLMVAPILMPALLNLIQNAVLASNTDNPNDFHIEITVAPHIANNTIVISIRDHGVGFANDTLLQLGSELVDSKHGLGMGVFLSHVTLDKLGGQLKLYNHQQGGAVAEVILPLLAAQPELDNV
ncbi:HAMP domain-containing sensor histidine kinase [Psychrosphaera aquimarina]|uniref:histidine kinase n=1 Tax=Psychrosphaera aquimarina TaxID=2044854 RepID=A0ABU3QX75_9GAMM|nr:HAMP domain-containing sensor histidine kinase [Psychrosphaera aquimarina]MDU0112020.1 HAMP domain-containing sensor histidine kinase [Psychrosphaera aquimarina]